MPKIEILLKNDGSFSVEGVDFVGESCKEKTAFLDELFGEPTGVKLKDEFYSKEYNTDCISNGLCG